MTPSEPPLRVKGPATPSPAMLVIESAIRTPKRTFSLISRAATSIHALQHLSPSLALPLRPGRTLLVASDDEES